MTNIDSQRDRRAGGVIRLAGEWWPVPALIAVVVFFQWMLLSSRYDVSGHASGHLDGATAPFMAAAAVPILFWATPRARRHVDVLVAAGLWFTATVFVMIGNLRVVDDLVASGYGRTPTGSIPDVADHSLANSSVWYAWAAALLLVGAFRRRGHIGNRATLGAVVATVIVPPWIIPGAGVIVLVVVRLVRRAQENGRRAEHRQRGYARFNLSAGAAAE